MFFYPDQYFYQRQAQPRTSRRPSARGGFNGSNRDPYGGAQIFTFGEPGLTYERPDFSEPYYVLDEDEYRALAAFREARRRSSLHDKQAAILAARRRAEQEQRAREIAQRRHDAEIRAQVEADARTAAREYLRRKQLRQQEAQRAQYEERKRRQQLLLEQLRDQFGFFPIIQTQHDDEDPDSEFQKVATDAGTPGDSEKLVSNDEKPEDSEPSQQSDSASKQADQRKVVDPIRSLVEALSPYPVTFTTDSSDEEETAAEPKSKPIVTEPTESSSKSDTSNSQDTDGPTCETASENDEDEDPYEVKEARSPSQSVPVPDYEVYDDRDSDYEDEPEDPNANYFIPPGPSMFPFFGHNDGWMPGPRHHHPRGRHAHPQPHSRGPPRAHSPPPHPHPHPHHKSKKHHAKKPKVAVPEKSSAEACGLVCALKEDLERVTEAYNRLSQPKDNDSLEDVIARIEGVKIGYGRSEEIYSQLDNMKVGKDQRTLKHQVTTDAVALADKYDELLKNLYARRDELREQQRAAESEKKPTEVKHHVSLEDIHDDSESI